MESFDLEDYNAKLAEFLVAPLIAVILARSSRMEVLAGTSVNRLLNRLRRAKLTPCHSRLDHSCRSRPLV
eukprot:2720006-Pyramimonas_sp.AAC.1